MVREEPEHDETEEAEERSVAIEVTLDDGPPIPDLDAKLETLRAAIADRGGVPLGSGDARRYGARFLVTAPEADSAVDAGVEVFKDAVASAGLPDAPITDVEASTLGELERAGAGHDVPDLVGVPELAELLGVGHHLVTILVRAKGFPRPAAELNSGPLWTVASVDRYLRAVRSDGGEQRPSGRA